MLMGIGWSIVIIVSFVVVIVALTLGSAGPPQVDQGETVTPAMMLLCAGAAVVPFAVAVILSLSRCLSIGRWIAMAGFFTFIWFVGTIFLGAIRSNYLYPWDQPQRDRVDNVLAPFTLGSISAIAGCLLAAAIYPKKSK